MEQKQLDDLDNYTEEFIEDETPEEHMVLKARRERKALAMKRLAERAAKESAEKEQLVKTAKQNLRMKATEVKIEPIKVETYTDDEIMITPVKEELRSVKTAPPVEVSTPVNPWANEENKDEAGSDTGFFQDVSTWQAFTGILIILLIFSIFTQGFQFKVEGTDVKGAVEQNKAEVTAAGVAKEKVTEDKSTESAVTTPVTDSTAVSSVNTTEVVPAATSDAATQSSPEVKSDSVNKANTDSSNNSISAKGSTVTSSSSTVSEAPGTSMVKTVPRQVSLGAKKWRFSSEKITVKQNDHVILTVRPESMAFTFAIKELSVEKEVSGTTMIEFDALTKGTFGFSCSSCEEWRGMIGTLVVE